MTQSRLSGVSLAAAALATVAMTGLPGRSASAMQLVDPATAPAPAPILPATAFSAADGEHLTVTVSQMKGAVQYCTDEDEKNWRPCTVGLVLGEGASFRTGLGASVTFTLPPNQTITLDRLGKIKVLQAIKQNNGYKTDVGMKYGRTNYEVQAAGIEHESTVRTPNSTLAVRGTGVKVSDQRPFAAEIEHFEGLSEYTNGGRKQILANGYSRAVGGQAAADVSLFQSVVDPNIAFARTPAEVPLVNNLLSRGAVILTQNDKGIPIVKGGVPPTDSQLKSLLPGRLNFVLRWDGPANLNLTVGNLAGTGEAIYPATGANTSKSGGLIPFDHQGGPKGGVEIAYWGKSFPTGVGYPIGVTNVGGKTVDWSVEVFLDGQPITTYLDTVTGSPTTTPPSGRIAAGDQQGGIAFPAGGAPPPPPGPGPGIFSTASGKPPALTRQSVKALTAKTRFQNAPMPARAFARPDKTSK